ncbi:MAG: purine-binding chemotaxis protein CheW [Deltaproteobacteria bacterium]|nr:purine-binding chemotaxis protein CheW [Deltaproteobacteria bacterium]
MSHGQIDWNEIHRRLEAIHASIENGFSTSPEDKKRILKARADLLAREPEDTADGDAIEIVEFKLANEHYAMESRYVREIYPLKNYTPLPCTPPFVLGLLNIRGRIVSIVDIKKFFDMPEKGIGDLNKVIIIHDDRMEFGILADSILGVRNIAMREIQPSLPTLTGIREEYLKGITGEQMVVLDARKLLEDKKMIVHQEA